MWPETMGQGRSWMREGEGLRLWAQICSDQCGRSLSFLIWNQSHDACLTGAL